LTLRAISRTLFGIDTRRNLWHALERVRSLRPQIVVCTGDFPGTPETTDTIELALREFAAVADRVAVVPGNHDQSATVAEVYARLMGEPCSWPTTLEVGPARVILLDTSEGYFGQIIGKLIIGKLNSDCKRETAVRRGMLPKSPTVVVRSVPAAHLPATQLRTRGNWTDQGC
jgi:3',5'-cyclic AMP phosphodiesterase CpdA